MDFIFNPGLVLYLPLYKLDGSSFMSRDKHGHLCTVTGATWRPAGRYFDGIDDRISATFTPPSGALSLCAWFKVQSSDSGALIALRDDAAVHTMRIEGTVEYKVAASGNTRRWSFDGRDGNWHFICLTVPGNGQNDISSAVLYADGVSQSVVSTSTSGTPGARNSFQLGSESSGAYYLNCNIGEVWIYNRVLTPLELQHNYLATKWRYK